ncbi:methyltransferase domain-containing protein [Bdellovibrio sp. HCB337]|uniref:methyltransferase domain-containing protein n=1 Tax=Bdellovibrio sp. HCB337 TaxID=3394358 RepID=UPI0039A497A8
MNSKWNPTQYNKFKDQRARPFYDLMSLIQDQPFEEAIDLGCGTGELTRKLFESFQIKHLLGIDASDEMLEKSKTFVTAGLEFQLQNIESFVPRSKYDLIFSNAALQWIDNHEVLVPKILSWLKPGGQIAIQVPCNFDHPSHTLASEVAHRLFPDMYRKGEQRLFVLPVEKYAEIFHNNGIEEQITRIEVYGNPMKSGLDVVEWTKGTMLTSYQSRLNPSDFDRFLKTYTEEIRKALGEGPYFYPFKRMLLWGKKI